jgi:hypothetical protein
MKQTSQRVSPTKASKGLKARRSRLPSFDFSWRGKDGMPAWNRQGETGLHNAAL